MNNLEKFNVTFTEFIEDLVKVIPEDPELRVYELMLRSAVKNNPNYVVDVFNTSVVELYEKEIMEKNEEFFLKEDYDLITQTNSDALEIIVRIKSYWTQLTEEDKIIVWKYLRILVLLTKKIKNSGEK